MQANAGAAQFTVQGLPGAVRQQLQLPVNRQRPGSAMQRLQAKRLQIQRGAQAVRAEPAFGLHRGLATVLCLLRPQRSRQQLQLIAAVFITQQPVAVQPGQRQAAGIQRSGVTVVELQVQRQRGLCGRVNDRGGSRLVGRAAVWCCHSGDAGRRRLRSVRRRRLRRGLAVQLQCQRRVRRAVQPARQIEIAGLQRQTLYRQCGERCRAYRRLQALCTLTPVELQRRFRQ